MTRNLAAIAFVLLMAVQAEAQSPQPTTQTVKYRDYGIQIDIPTPFESRRETESKKGITDAFTVDGMLLIVGINTGATLAQMEQDWRRHAEGFSLGTLTASTCAGGQIQGISGMRDISNQVYPKDDPVHEILAGAKQEYALGFCLVVGSAEVAIGALAPGDRASDLVNLARHVISSARPIPAGQAERALVVPQIGQIADGEVMLVGLVVAADCPLTEFTLLADQVAVSGCREIAPLDPPRKKLVKAEGIDQPVCLGDRVAVIGRDQGTGTPLRAKTVCLVK